MYTSYPNVNTAVVQHRPGILISHNMLADDLSTSDNSSTRDNVNTRTQEILI